MYFLQGGTGRVEPKRAMVCTGERWAQSTPMEQSGLCIFLGTSKQSRWPQLGSGGLQTGSEQVTQEKPVGPEHLKSLEHGAQKFYLVARKILGAPDQ